MSQQCAKPIQICRLQFRKTAVFDENGPIGEDNASEDAAPLGNENRHIQI